MEHATQCLNCRADLAPEQRYCSHCGQAADTHRVSLVQFVRELAHALLNADRNVFALTAALARRPGLVIRDYLAGQRKRYFNPFAFLLLVAALSTLALDAVTPRASPPSSSAAATSAPTTSAPSTDTAAARTEAQKRRARDVGEFMRKQQNLVMLLAVPFNAALFWLAFARRRLHYAEHLVANTFLVAFLMLFTALVFYPASALARGTPAYFPILMAMLLAHALYSAWSYVQWLGLVRWPQRLYALAVAVAVVVAWGGLTTALTRAYIRGFGT